MLLSLLATAHGGLESRFCGWLGTCFFVVILFAFWTFAAAEVDNFQIQGKGVRPSYHALNLVI